MMAVSLALALSGAFSVCGLLPLCSEFTGGLGDLWGPPVGQDVDGKPGPQHLPGALSLAPHSCAGICRAALAAGGQDMTGR